MLPGEAGCARCGLSLVGPDAVELSDLDRRLAELLAQRAQLLSRLGGRRGPGPAPLAPPPSGPEVRGAAAWPGGAAPPTPRAPVLGGQQLLLALGALLVLTASVVFLAVNWSLLGPIGQLSVALAAAGLCAGLSGWTLRHQLRSSAEAFAMLSVLLLVATGIGARVLELFGDLDGAVFAAVATAALTGLCAGLSRLVQVTAYRIGAVVSAQFVAPAAVLALDGSPPLVLAAIAAGGLVTLALVADWQPLTVGLTAAASWAIATLVGTVGIWADARALGHGLVVVAAAVGAALLTRHPLRPLGWPTAAIAAVSTLYVVADPWAAAVAVVALAVAALAVAGGPAVGGSAVGGLAVGGPADGGPVDGGPAGGLVGRGGLVDLGRAWVPLQFAAVAAALVVSLAAALSDDHGVFAVAGCTVLAMAARHLNRVPVALAPATVLAAGAVAVAADLSLAVTLSVVAVAVAASGVAVLELPLVTSTRVRWWALGAAVPCFAGLWLIGLQALTEPQPLGLGEFDANAASSIDTVALQRANAVVFAAAAALALWAMARLPQRWLAVPAAALASIAGWWAMASLSLDAIEWYSLSAACFFAAAGFGPLRRANSFAALGPAALLALWPTSAVAVLDNDLARLSAALVAAAAVAVGAVQARRAAPLYVAAAALAWLVVGQLENWSSYVPRWAVLATIGALLLAAGVSFEASRRAARTMVDFLRSLR